jgi:murein tripeptide amidase MpaA
MPAMNLTLRSFATFLFLATTCFAQKPDWTTPSEKSGYRTTPDYADTMAYIRRVAAAVPKQVKIEPFGKTGEGRTLYTVIVSKDRVITPTAARAAKRAIVLVQNGIHAGEIDGKDASLALLRDMVITKTRADLLDRAVIVIIPVYNIDGHERISKYNRINQNGPEEMGWRTTALNLNLNRDYMKADAPETRAFLKLWNKWLPDFYFDNHVTDGADYQYAITYGVDSGPDVDPGIAKWLRDSLFPYIDKTVTERGQVIGPFINLVDDTDPSKGITAGQSVPRFSNGYTTIQNRPGMLVEMHMLKDYKTRVVGNYELMRATIEAINRDADTLIALNRAADANTIVAGKNGDEIALTVAPSKTTPFDFKAFKYDIRKSEIAGTNWIEYHNDQPVTISVPMQTNLKVVKSVKLPAGYIVPAQWTRVIDVLAAHGIAMRKLTAPLTADVEQYRCDAPNWQSRPFEGRHTASFSGVPMGDAGFQTTSDKRGCKLSRATVTYPAGSVIVSTAQRAAKVAAHFLEPEGPDSAVVWGFFDAIFEQKEYGEGYVMEKVARDMLAKDPQLKTEFEAKKASDKDFAANPFAIYNWFYQRSPWWDDHIGLYPVGRLIALPPAAKRAR